MDDKKILYQMLSREIDRLLSGNPMFRMFSSTISNWVISVIDPYVTAFIGNDSLNTEAAEKFVKQEVNDKISAFMAKFKEEQQK